MSGDNIQNVEMMLGSGKQLHPFFQREIEQNKKDGNIF